MVNQDIVSRFKDGDADAFRIIYDRYKVQVMNYCMTMVLSRESAEELVNDVFYQLYQKRDYLDITRDIKPYLFSITKNMTYNWLKTTFGKKKIRERFEAEYKTLYLQHQDMRVDARLDLQQLEKDIEEMPSQRQLIFKMCKFQEMTYAEVAQALSIMPKTVENQMGLANKQFAEIASRADYVFFAFFICNIFFG